MTGYKGITYLRNKLNAKRVRVTTRYEYYEMKNLVKDFSRMLPPDMQWLNGTLGWCAKTVDCMADRLVFREFDEDNFEMNEIFRLNNPDTLYDSAVLSALIASCCFIYISPDADGYPRLQVIDGGNATGVIDPITGLLSEGYSVLKRDEDQNPELEAYFVPGRTDYYPKGMDPYSVETAAPAPLLVPIIHRPDAVRPFGHSRISRTCMGLMQSALRTIKRAEIAGEFYSFPQKYILGLSEDTEIDDKWKAAMTSLLTISRDENGEMPTVGQFTQQSMTPYLEQLKMFAALFAGETGLTMDDLGFASDNPSSVEAIKAAHENLRLAARKAQRTIGTGFLNTGYLAACVRDEYPYRRQQVYLTQPKWEPIFEPDAAMMSLIGDGAIKLNQAVPGYYNKDNLRDITGINASNMQPPEV